MWGFESKFLHRFHLINHLDLHRSEADFVVVGLSHEIIRMQFYCSKNSQNPFDHVLSLKKKNLSILAYIEKKQNRYIGQLKSVILLTS